MPQRPAPTDHPVHDLLARRWSPCAFDSRLVPVADLQAIFEAARWAPSCYNEQPWRYIVATRDQPAVFASVLSCLVEPNQAWAANAPVLALGVVSLKFARNGNPNAHAAHDLGQASAQLAVEATARGLFVHQMGGILPDKAREVFSIPADYAALTGLAIGYGADPAGFPEGIRQRDAAPRQRRPMSTFVFGDVWHHPAAFVSAR